MYVLSIPPSNVIPIGHLFELGSKVWSQSAKVMESIRYSQTFTALVELFVMVNLWSWEEERRDSLILSITRTY